MDPIRSDAIRHPFMPTAREQKMRPELIEEYIVFRFRLLEMLHLWTLWARYGLLPDDDPEREIGRTLGVVVQVWLRSFFDPRRDCLNVLRLWRAVFPEMKRTVTAWEAANRETLKILQEFRHTTGAHVSKRIVDHNRVREAFTPKRLGLITEAFLDIAGEAVTRELDHPNLAEEIARFGLPPGRPLANRNEPPGVGS